MKSIALSREYPGRVDVIFGTRETLAEASSLRAEVVAGLDLLIVRELTGGIYFGEPRGIRTLENGERQGFNTYVYRESEIERIGRLAFESAGKRDGRPRSPTAE